MSATAQAHAAIIAAKNYDRWGPYAATVYASRRGASVAMLCMAMGFEHRRAMRAQRGAA
ncbi:MAG: hypothetical protein WA049_20155 [Ferribacterium limneticum]